MAWQKISVGVLSSFRRASSQHEKYKNDNHTDYHVFVLHVIKNMSKVLGSEIKPRIHAHLFYLALQLGLRYPAHALVKGR